MRLFSAQTANADGASFPVPVNRMKSELFTLYVWGTFTTGSVTIEISPDGGTTWFKLRNADDSGNLTFTAKGVINVQFRATHVRAVLASGTSESINVALI